MQPIQLGGVVLKVVNINGDTENGTIVVTGSYHLITTQGTVLAQQAFNGYKDVELKESQETLELRKKFLDSMQKDLLSSMGLG